MINTTNSRYLAELKAENSLDLAIPKVVLDTNDFAEQILPGETLSYEFYVKNHEDNNINEVLMEYYFKINITQDDLPLEYKVFDITENTEVELSETADGIGPIELKYGEIQENNYRIDFIWDENDNSSEYANKQFSFKIELNATQVVN